MQEFEVFDWSAMRERLHAKRKFLYWFIPAILIGTWGLTFSVATYYECTATMTPEDLRPAEQNRVMTLNRPENYDLGIAQLMNSVSAEDYCQIVSSTKFLCQVLQTPVMTRDSIFSGTYYAYLATQYRYPWHKAVMRFLRGKKRSLPDEALPEPDPFYLRGVAADAYSLASKHISATTDRRTLLFTISVEAQDPLVAALVAQSVQDNLENILTDYHNQRFDALRKGLDEQLRITEDERQAALEAGDKERAAMLAEACRAFERQAIILRAQVQNVKKLAVLRNVSVPTQKAGPHHITLAVIITALVTLFALIWICRKELFGMQHKA